MIFRSRRCARGAGDSWPARGSGQRWQLALGEAGGGGLEDALQVLPHPLRDLGVVASPAAGGCLAWLALLPLSVPWMLVTRRLRHTPRNYWRYAAEWLDVALLTILFLPWAPSVPRPSWPPRGYSGSHLLDELF
ncbi:hypothetical protein CLV92_1037 [Kineococcus xinjiangensis]|uniref:Uncharacterized protein n=1 Tax=Kineococcus xinjiangensis TaxID=512762 RepID=A0A2S6IT93_9ACTN|nr:hypothetical protein [Kineococcus xinjiangensis]PPK97477.1 hypothetical protein CLV92_1037 [Kineococcus xinjiangensis]